MKIGKILTLSFLLLALVAIVNHELTQNSDYGMNTSLIANAQAQGTPTPTPTPTPTSTPTPGNQGCTPGFWKNHTGAWKCFTPTQTVNSVFDGVVPALANATLLQALSFQGGSTLQGAEEILLRAAVAALLNSCASSGVDYPLTTAQVITMVNTAIATGDRGQILGTAAALDGLNNGGCPINGR